MPFLERPVTTETNESSILLQMSPWRLLRREYTAARPFLTLL